MKKSLSVYLTYAGFSLAVFFISLFMGAPADANPLKCDGEKVKGELCAFEAKPYLTKEFTLDGPGILKAYTLAGNIEVQTIEASSKVKVELYLDRGYSFWSNSKNLDNYRITVIQRGNEIVSSVERKSKETGFFSDQMRFSFKIYVPEEMSTELKTSGGNISVSGLSGHHMIKTSGGNIDLDEINGKLAAYTAGGNINVNKSSGTIYGKTTGGNITVDQSSGEIRLLSDGGRIIAERISGTLLAKLGGGDIKAQFLRVSEGISLDTGAGNIFLEIPEMDGFDLVLNGTEIKLPTDLSVDGYRSLQRVEGTVKRGGAPINVSTNHGKIELKIN
ncbi:DUF4097 domain-containing protein [Balneolaceae bacterium YR4-1]|uniref:DUF4097 domain-containing protein n=1 Tax=Halalkalibaculum roseum TaxID=2709311 RepID=A0A6M1SU52_9BACT|nr:DUF4097 family beta strand repeat-containing protein [Halalkalibaculum roseum]NGP76460.1 DUF4097 domain-containing protein [Halalkalibaculum roseum]